MNLKVVFLVICCVTCSFAATSVKKSETKDVTSEQKLKQEATISKRSAYDGPSYKYLPPSSSPVSDGFESYSGGHHHGGSHVEEGPYDFGGSDNTIGNDFGHFAPKTPKVETFIVETKPAHGHQVAPAHGVSSGYRYSEPSHSFGGDHSGYHSGGLESGYTHQGPVAEKTYKAIVIPTRGYSTPSHASSGYGYSRYGGSGGGGGFTGGSHFSSKHLGSSYSGNSFSSMHAGFGSAHGPHSSGPYHSLEASYRVSEGSQDGYSYDAPISSSHSHGSPRIPATSYGVPVNDISSSFHHSSVEQSEGHSHHGPSYASGHKGLGHFGYTANRPQALHTSYIESSRYGSSYPKHISHGSSHTPERIPFKPSLFLGATYENIGSGGGISTDYGGTSHRHGVSSRYIPPPTSDGYDYPPTSALYGTPSHSHSAEDSSGPAYEPESTYLPPSASSSGNYSPPSGNYLPPAPISDSYLPPHH